MDEINWKIVKELQLNARISIVELSKKIGLSPPSISERIQKLEDACIIEGYSAKINMKNLGYTLCVHISIKVRFGMIKKFEEYVTGVEEVMQCHKLTGEDCMMMKAYVRDTDHLEKLNSRLSKYGELTTSLLLSSIVKDKLVEKQF